MILKKTFILCLAVLVLLPVPSYSQNVSPAGPNIPAPQTSTSSENNAPNDKSQEGVAAPPVRYLHWTGFDQTRNEPLYIVNGQTQVFRFDRPIARIAISRPEICDALPLGTQEILMHSRGVGKMNFIVWDTRYNTSSYNLVSTIDVDQLLDILRGIDPKAELKVLPYNDSVAIFGTTTNSQTLGQINAAANKFQGGIQSFVEIKNPKQILLEVRLAEIDRNSSETYGFNTLSIIDKNGKRSSYGFTEAFDTVADPNFGLNFLSHTQEYNVSLQWLIEKGIAKIVARPNLLAKDGQEASFFVGGEFPIPTYSQNAGDVYISVTYKDYGTKLTFTPRVINNDLINLQITTEISEIDDSHTVVIAPDTTAIPGTLNRTHKTVAELKDNEMLVIGGMITQRIGETHSKIPILGDIPVIDKLFKSTDFTRTDLDLLVIIVPHIVEPLSQPSATKEFYSADNLKKIEKSTRVISGPYPEPQADAMRKVIVQSEGQQPFDDREQTIEADIAAASVLQKQQEQLKEPSKKGPWPATKTSGDLPPTRNKTEIKFAEEKTPPPSEKMSENIQKIMRREEIVLYN